MSVTSTGEYINPEAHFRLLFEEAPLPYQSLDDGARLLGVNRTWEKTFGFTRGEVLGHFFGDFLTPGQEGKLHLAFRAFLDSGTVDGIEFEFRCKDGARKQMSLNGRVARDAEDRFLRTHCILNDITERKEMEVALRDSEEKWRSLTENSPDNIMFLDSNATIQFINRPVFELTVEDLLGTCVYDYIPPDYQDIVKSRIDHTLSAGEPTEYETDVYASTGEIQSFSARVGPVLRDGRVLGVTISTRDVTERKNAEKALGKSEQRLRTLINATADDSVVLLDPDFRIEIANERAARGFGRTVDQVIGRSVHELLSPLIANTWQKNWASAIDTGQSVRFETQCAGRWYDNNMCPVFGENGKPQANAIFAREITDRKTMEQALQEAKAVAEKANVAKSRFLAAANHDLRQPLHAMRLLLESLSICRLDSQANDIVLDMKDAVKFMEVLLNELLDISKLEAGLFVPRKQHFHVLPFFHQLGSQFRTMADHAGKRIRIAPTSAVIYTDPILLGCILQNFVSNAIRHARGDSVLVGCRRADDCWRIEVWDNGTGISTEYLDKIFDEFYQIGFPGRNISQGLGLGLTIAKRMADLLNLKIHVRSFTGKGSVFSVEVASGKNAKQAPEKSPTIETSRVCRRGFVLIVDDDHSVLNATKTLLDMLGHNAICASSSEEAIDQAKRIGPDLRLALLDYRLPNGWTGIQLIQTIRKELNRELPAVLISGDTSTARLRDVQTSGFPLLHKPVDPADLLSLLKIGS